MLYVEERFNDTHRAWKARFITPVRRRDGSFVVPRGEVSTVGFNALAAVFANAMTRCKKCGHTIDEHRSATEQGTAVHRPIDAILKEMDGAGVKCRVYRDDARDGTKRVGHEDFGAAVFHHADYLQELIRRLGVGEARSPRRIPSP